MVVDIMARSAAILHVRDDHFGDVGRDRRGT
jgi:hypothetical protein